VAEAPECPCPKAKRENGWCEKCAVGYLALIEIRSRALFDVLDAHGHDIDPAAIRCVSCRKALATDGYCERSRMGFVNQQAYLSRLAYYVARGKVRDRSTVSCKTCRKNAEKYGWCEACKIGTVGDLTFRGCFKTRSDGPRPSAVSHSSASGRTARGKERGRGDTTESIVESESTKHRAAAAGRSPDGVLKQPLRHREDLKRVHKELLILKAAVRTLDRCERCALATLTAGRCRLCDNSYKDGKKVP